MAFCQQCGHAQGNADERFCGACGTPYPAAAPETGMPPTVLPPPGKASGRTITTIVASVVTVAALIAGALFLIPGSPLSIWSQSGGASNPREAASGLVDALSAQDPVQLVNMIEPDEVSGLGDLLSKGKSNLQAKSGGTQGRLTDALQFSTSGVQFQTQGLPNGDGGQIQDVKITGGTYSITLDASKLPPSVKDQLTQLSGGQPLNLPPAKTLNGTITEAFDKAHFTGHDVIAVKHGGRWYISFYATIANLAYEAGVSNGSVPSNVQPDWSRYTNPPSPITASDPAGVITNLIQAANDKNIEEVLRNLPQGEVRGLYPFIPVFNAVSHDSGSDSSKVSATNVQATTQDRGDTVAATYTGGAFTSTTADGKTSTVTLTPTCATMTDSSGSSNKRCIPGPVASALQSMGYSGVVLILRKVAGGYQFDPIASYINGAKAAAAHSDQIKQLFMGLMQAELSSMSSMSYAESSSYPSTF